MTGAAPRVTVIIPTYNWSTVLPSAIGSVLDQTWTDFELLVIGDDCTDDSEAVVRAVPDPRVRWINLRPGTRHQYGPNNEGLRQARGEVIAYLGHDDLWLPQHLAIGLAALDAGADLAHSMALLVGPGGRAIGSVVATRAGWMPPTCVLHRRRVTDAIGSWRDYREIDIGPEHDYWRRARAAGFRFAYVPRLTAVKFSASLRRNVYRERPCHEQEAWLARIRSEPDFEAAETARIAAPASRARQAARRVWRLLAEPSQWPAFVWRRRGARIKARQRYKGVEHLH